MADLQHFPDPDGLDHQVTSEHAGDVAVVTFSRPPRNHFSPALLASLADAFEALDKDDAVRATVLRSEGDHFCAGADLQRSSGDPLELYDQGARLFALRKPIVAAVQGGAIGGGLGLALVADFRIVASTTRLAANFVKLGTHPGFALTHTLPRLVGAQRAAELMLTGRRITGEEALALGLADRLTPEADLLSGALSFAETIAANAPLAVEETRATLRTDLVAAIRRQTDLERAKQLRLRMTADFVEGVRAVAERRPGRWTRG